MGLWISKLFNMLSELASSSPSNILMLGLDNAGKTTILYKIKLNENVQTIPTIGFNVETVSPVKGISFTVWDVGGQAKIRRLWKHYYQSADGLAYVIDSNDRDRLPEASEELQDILGSDEMRGVPVVIVANKQDLPSSMSPSEIAAGLGLSKMTNRKWHIHGPCAKTGEGIFESMKEMADMVKDRMRVR